jgi:hypothetical protein
MKTRTLGIVFPLIATLALVAPAGSAPTVDFSGVYKCDGRNADGSPYEGIVEIMKVQNTYRVRWTLARGQVHVGLGIATNDFLSVSYYSEGGAGVIVYGAESNGERLVGRWTELGAQGELFTETLTKAESVEGLAPLMKRRRKPTAISI